MPFRIAKTLVVESGHLLSKHPGACRFPHGHSRSIEVVLTSDTLDPRDMVCDFKAIKHLLAGIVSRYDHSLSLNTADPHYPALRASYGENVIPFDNADPTTEVLARTIFQELRAQLAAPPAPIDPTYPIPAGIRLERVRVTETASSWAEYWE